VDAGGFRLLASSCRRRHERSRQDARIVSVPAHR